MKSRKKRKRNCETPFVNTAETPSIEGKTPRLSDEVAGTGGEIVDVEIGHDPDAATVENSTPAPANSFPPSVIEPAPATALADDDDDEGEDDHDYELPSVGLFSGSATGDDLSSSQPTQEDDDEDEEGEGGASELVHLLDDVQDDEEEADYDYYPDETDLKKTILVGDNHQAEIPPTVLPRKDTTTEPVIDDELMWSPHSDKVDDGVVERFLSSFYKLRRHLNHPEDTPDVADTEQFLTHHLTDSSPGRSIKDEECALRKLLEADYNVEVALQQVCTLMQTNGAVPSTGGYCNTTPAVTWSEEECRNFELGIRLYGKNFTLIHATKVPSRSVQELVQFYYFWKKTERYDSFAAKQRLEKKRHSMSNQNPGLTEFMDKFLEEQQQPGRSISPRHSSVTMTPPPSSSMVHSLSAVEDGDEVGGQSDQGEHKDAEDDLVDIGPKSPGAGGQDENHSLLIYADSKRHRTSGGAVPSTPPANNASEIKHPLEGTKEILLEDAAAES